MIDYDELEELDMLPRHETIRKSTDPVGSLTDNRRMVKSQRDGAIKRARQLKEQMHNA